jgi:hypothetical protein
VGFFSTKAKGVKMKGKVLTIVACLFLLPLSASFVLAHPTAKVPKTGQTTKYATGDDGDYEKGVAWPNPRFTDNGDETVTDNLTGLMWIKDANYFETTKTWLGAIVFCRELEFGKNGCNLYTDWRLPNSNELASLIDKGNHTTALPAPHPFYNMQFGYYWSSTTSAINPNGAWYVYVYYGHVGVSSKSDSNYVWPVRGGND